MERTFADAEDLLRHNPIVAGELSKLSNALIANQNIFDSLLRTRNDTHSRLAGEQQQISSTGWVAPPQPTPGETLKADAVGSIGERKPDVLTSTPGVGKVHAQNVPIFGTPTHYPVQSTDFRQFMRQAAQRLEAAPEFQEFGRWINSFIDAIRPHVAAVADPAKYPKTGPSMDPHELQRAKMTAGRVDYNLPAAAAR